MSDFPTVPRLARAARLACKLLLQDDIRRLPVDPIAIIRRHGFRLTTYRKAAERRGITAAELADVFGTEDAFSAMTPGTGQVLIVYNDSLISGERVRFSLCHELGHLFLRHFDFPEDSLTSCHRRLLDLEANTFAANLLCPVPVIQLLRKPLQDADRHLFSLSALGWHTRLRTLPADVQALPPALYQSVQEQFRPFMAQRHCCRCGASFLRPVDVCPACGHAPLQWSPDACPMDFPWTPETWARSQAPR